MTLLYVMAAVPYIGYKVYGPALAPKDMLNKNIRLEGIELEGWSIKGPQSFMPPPDAKGNPGGQPAGAGEASALVFGSGTTFIGASFRGAALIGVNFSRCLLDDSDFSNAKVSGCRFYEADLSKIKGLDSVVLDWIDVGTEDNPQKLFGIEGVKWLQEASMK